MLFTFLIPLFKEAKSQSGISLYHLNNSTFQGNNFNAAYMPEGKLFLGIPGISGIAADVNSPYSYNDAFTTNELGENQLDIDNMVRLANNVNFVAIQAEVSTLYLGFRPKSTTAFSFFIRERVSAAGFYTDETAQFAWEGNGSFAGNELDLNNTILDARYYREYGLGLWKSIPNKGINFGVRLKFLNGMASIITDKNFDGTVQVGQNYDHNFNVNNARLNMSGYNLLTNDSTSSDELTSHLISNGNLGFGIDLGAHWKINDQLSASVAINDLGFINWKDDTENMFLIDTTFYYEGVSQNASDFGEAIQDSLFNRFADSTTFESYRSGLNTSAYGSLLFQLTPDDLITGTIGTHVVQDRFRMLYAIGYTRKVGDILKASANVIRTPQQSIDLGLAVAATFGPFQMYMASDKVIKIWNVPEARAFDFRFGINFIFGRTKEVKDDRSDLQHPSIYGKKERVEKSDGIYWIIKRQHPRPIYEPPKRE
ncbi:MAG: hypothetical protein JXR07_18585 [Reichenbachiella sp.]